MLSKFLPNAMKLLVAKTPQMQGARKILGLVPPNQYDTPIPKRLNIAYVMRVYWETIPLFLTTGLAFSLCGMFLIYAAKNKVDLVFSTHNRENISRTMDLRNPRVLKLIIINQRYEPWPEMQDVLDKMKAADKRAQVRLQTCSSA